MGQDLVSTHGARRVMSIDLTKVNYGAANAAIDKYMAAVGGGNVSDRQSFPGVQYSFNKGAWKRGFGKDAPALKAGARLVVNAPNFMLSWSKWMESQGGKRYPHYEPVVFPVTGEPIAERESLGDTDTDAWDVDDKNVPLDPWKLCCVFPVRDEGDYTINHILVNTTSANIAMFKLFKEIMEMMPMKSGQLPVVALGSTEASRDVKVKQPNGKEKVTKQTWFVPSFKVVGWTDATEADNPGEGGIDVTADDNDGDVGEVEDGGARVEQAADAGQEGCPGQVASSGEGWRTQEGR